MKGHSRTTQSSRSGRGRSSSSTSHRSSSSRGASSRGRSHSGSQSGMSDSRRQSAENRNGNWGDEESFDGRGYYRSSQDERFEPQYGSQYGSYGEDRQGYGEQRRTTSYDYPNTYRGRGGYEGAYENDQHRDSEGRFTSRDRDFDDDNNRRSMGRDLDEDHWQTDQGRYRPEEDEEDNFRGESMRGNRSRRSSSYAA